MSENASLSISMSFFTAPKLADTFFSIWLVVFCMIFYDFDIYKVLFFVTLELRHSRGFAFRASL